MWLLPPWLLAAVAVAAEAAATGAAAVDAVVRLHCCGVREVVPATWRRPQLSGVGEGIGIRERDMGDICGFTVFWTCLVSKNVLCLCRN